MWHKFKTLRNLNHGHEFTVSTLDSQWAGTPVSWAKVPGCWAHPPPSPECIAHGFLCHIQMTATHVTRHAMTSYEIMKSAKLIHQLFPKAAALKFLLCQVKQNNENTKIMKTVQAVYSDSSRKSDRSHAGAPSIILNSSTEVETIKNWFTAFQWINESTCSTVSNFYNFRKNQLPD